MTDPLSERALARVGTTIRGRWVVDVFGGADKAGAVYRGHDATQPAFLAIQHLELSHDPARARQFARQAAVARWWGHPSVARVLDAGATDDGAVFIALEWLDGRTCAMVAAQQPGGRLAVADVLRIADAVLDALAAAHGRGLIHANLRPDKLFWTQSQGIKITGVGDARFFGPAAQSAMIEAHDPTASGGTRLVSATELVQPKGMGSTAFMPPEQARGDWDQMDGRSDLWALGAVLFALAAGRAVRLEPAGNQQLLAAATKPAPPLAQALPGVPPAVAAVVDRALAFEAAARWPDATTMQQAVRQALSSLTAARQPETAAPQAAPSAAPGTVFGARPAPGAVTPFATPSAAAPAPSQPVPSPSAPPPPSGVPGTVFGATAPRASALPFTGTPPPAAPSLIAAPVLAAAPPVLAAEPAPVAPPAQAAPPVLETAETPFSSGTVFGSRAALAGMMPFRKDAESPLAFAAVRAEDPATSAQASTGTVLGAAASAEQLPFDVGRGGAGIGPLSADAFAFLQSARWAGAEPFQRALERYGLDEVEWRLGELSLLHAIDSEAQRGGAALATQLLDVVEVAVTRRRLGEAK